MTTLTDTQDRTPQARDAGSWPRIALWLVGGTLAYNVIEAGVAVWSGVVADSVALMGFGLDSLIETAAAAMLLWRLRIEARGADAETIERTETGVHRFVGWTLVALALYVMLESA